MTARRALRWLLTLAAVSILGWGLVSSPGAELNSLDVGDKIACPKCAGESIAASQTPTARAMMELLDERIAEGMTEQEILDWFAARYGPDIILEPPLDLGGAVLWFVPFIVIAAGTVYIVRLGRDRPEVQAEEVPDKKGGSRSVVYILVAAVALTGVAFGLGRFIQPRAQGSAVSGNLQVDTSQNLDGVTNQEMEDVLGQFADIPQANRMRLALARRYFEDANYSKAVEHFQIVLGNNPTPIEASEALGRIGWILFVNGEESAAESAYLQALDALPGNGEASWFYSILLVETDRGDEAIPILEELLDSSDVPSEVRTEIERLMAEAGGEQ